MPNQPAQHYQAATVASTRCSEHNESSVHAGDTVVDLVCNDVVRVHGETPRHFWSDDTFYFCSPFCQRRFGAQPETFVRLGHGDPSRFGDDHAAT